MATRTRALETHDLDRERRERTDDLTIGRLAALTGVSAKAIRYYEEIGLLPRPPRGENRYRRYGSADINRLRLLRRIRLLGVPLSLARPLLIGASDARCADVQVEVLSLVRERLRAIDQEIAELGQLRAEIEGYQRTLSACHVDAGESFRDCADVRCIAPDTVGGAALQQEDCYEADRVS
jgi:MerR family mercuric resistance operon transcriptional regulator